MKRDNDKCRTCRYNAMLMGYNYHRCDYATLNWPRVKLKDFPDGPWRGPHCAAYEPMDPKKKRKARRVSEPIGKAMQQDRAEYKRKAAALCANTWRSRFSARTARHQTAGLTSRSF